MVSFRFYTTITLLALAVVLTTSAAFAQETPFFEPETASSNDFESLTLPEKYPQIQEQLDINVFPESPKPGETVTISVQTYGLDLNTQLITWKLNGTEKLKGVGQKKFTFTMGSEGTVSVVQFNVVTTSGSEITKTFRFSPVNVDVLWQANTYTPPFYKGKALYTPEANVIFVAMPNIIMNSQRVDPSNIVYTWKQNYDVQGSLSGFGKNTFNFDGPIFVRPTTIEVSAYAAKDPSLKGSGQVVVTPENPMVLLYEENPILGSLFNKSFSGTYLLNDNEVKLAAYPFYFSTTNKNSFVNYTWILNSNKLNNVPANQNNVVLKRTDSDAGSTLVSVHIGNSSKILQEAFADIRIRYDKLAAKTSI